MKVLLQLRFQVSFHHRLRNAVRNCRKGQYKLSSNPVSLWDGSRSVIPSIRFVVNASPVLKRRRVTGVDTLILGELQPGTFSVTREWTGWADPRRRTARWSYHRATRYRFAPRISYFLGTTCPCPHAKVDSMSLATVLSDQSYTWCAVRNRSRIAKTPESSSAPTALAQSHPARFRHRALQTMWQAGMPMRQPSRSWPQVLSFGELPRLAAANGLRAPGVLLSDRRAPRQLPPSPPDLTGDL